MNRADLLVFDLDGTLIDSRQDLANAGNATRGHMGMPALDDTRVWSYVGNGAPVLVRRLLGEEASQAQVQEGLEFFIEYYADHKLDYTTLYPGVREALDRLREAGVRMAVLTNKPVRISRAILDGLGVGGHFRQVYGGNSFDFKKPHPIGVETLMAECGAARDAHHDGGGQFGRYRDGAQCAGEVMWRDLRIAAGELAGRAAGFAGGPNGGTGGLGYWDGTRGARARRLRTCPHMLFLRVRHTYFCGLVVVAGSY